MGKDTKSTQAGYLETRVRQRYLRPRPVQLISRTSEASEDYKSTLNKMSVQCKNISRTAV